MEKKGCLGLPGATREGLEGTSMQQGRKDSGDASLRVDK